MPVTRNSTKRGAFHDIDNPVSRFTRRLRRMVLIVIISITRRYIDHYGMLQIFRVSHDNSENLL